MIADKEQAKRANFMKLEAMSLFAAIRANASSERWWYFCELRRLGKTFRFEQSISSYRASLSWDYVMCGIDCQIFLEREAQAGALGEDMWNISISGIEGKVNALTIQEQLRCLQQEGFYIPNGNENLERQMNFSLGLYGACMMHVDVKFPPQMPPLQAAMRVLDLLDSGNEANTPSLAEAFLRLEQHKKANLNQDDEDDPDIIMGDWQTWK